QCLPGTEPQTGDSMPLGQVIVEIVRAQDLRTPGAGEEHLGEQAQEEVRSLQRYGLEPQCSRLGETAADVDPYTHPQESVTDPARSARLKLRIRRGGHRRPRSEDGHTRILHHTIH